MIKLEKKVVPPALLISSDLSRTDIHLFFSTEYTISNNEVWDGSNNLDFCLIGFLKITVW